MPQLAPDELDRLHRAQALITAGESDRAEFELQEWCDHHDAPSAARVALASLLARRGELLRARVALGEPHRRDTYDMGADEAVLAVGLLIAAGDERQARQLAAWLNHLHGHDPEVARFVQLLDLPGLRSLPAVTHTHVDRMADELGSCPEIVPSLVFAQKLAPNTRTLSLLRNTVKKLVYKFEATAYFTPLVQALAQMAEMVGDEEDALRWAHRGLQADPYNASLALLLGRVEDNEAVGPPASQVLKRVSLKFPGYPDVQQAFVQRQEYDRRKTA